MLPYRDSRITTLILGIFFLIAIIYALFEARGQLMGPTIEIDTRVGTVEDPILIVQGRAERISSLGMNGRQIAVTEDGTFKEPYLLAVGYNRIVLEAKDAYGRSAHRTLEIVYTPDDEVSVSTENPYTPQQNSSTPTNATIPAPPTSTSSVATSSSTSQHTTSTTTP